MPYSMTAVQAADRLGVKQATLYAYVSRGVLGRVKAADGRGSLFNPDEVERLSLRGRPRRPAGAVGLTIAPARDALRVRWTSRSSPPSLRSPPARSGSAA